MKRKLLALAVAMTLFCTIVPTTVHAEPELEEIVTETIVEEYAYTNSITGTLSFSGSTATCQSTVTGNGYCTRIEGTQKLQKKVLWWWTDVDTWSKSVDGKVLNMLNTATVTDSGTYRVRVEATVYSGNNSENVYADSVEKTK